MRTKGECPLIRWILVLAGVFALPHSAFGQGVSIQGHVTDPQGNVVIHAAVTLERSENKDMIPLAGFSVATMFHEAGDYAHQGFADIHLDVERKVIETRALAAARNTGVPIPIGEVPGEEPDFTFDARSLGVELSELLCPASSKHGIMPGAEESYHQEYGQFYRGSSGKDSAETVVLNIYAGKMGWCRPD